MALLAYDVKDGRRMDITPVADFAASQVHAFGATPAGFVGINESALKTGVKASLNITDEHTFPKVDGTAALDGAPAYWDVSESEMTPTVTGNIRAGVFVGAFASGDTECRVNIGVR